MMRTYVNVLIYHMIGTFDNLKAYMYMEVYVVNVGRLELLKSVSYLIFCAVSI